MFIDLFCYIVIIILILIVAYYVNIYFTFKGLKDVKGPTPWPFVGNLLHFNTREEMLPKLVKCDEFYGKDFTVVLGPYPKVMVTDANTVMQIATSTELLEKDVFYKFFGKWLGGGLLTSTGKKWMKRRKIITPTFHFQILNNFISTFESLGDIFIEKLSEKVGKSVDVYPMVTLYSLDIICETALGVPVNAQTKSDSVFVVGVRDMLNLLTDRGFSVIKYFDFTYMFTRDYYRNRKLTKMLRGFTYDIIRKRRKEQREFNEDLVDEFGRKQRVAFLDMLLKSKIDGEPLSDEDIREEVDTFIFEGHDTTSTAISFALYSLSVEQDVQRKVLEEQKLIFEDDWNRWATFEDLSKMSYLETVIKEVLRLYPSVPVFGRIVRHDVKIDIGTLKSGTGLMFLPYGMHRNPEYFPDPYKFDPERFSAENILKIKPFSYIPFSAGQRNCIGQKFAMLDMKSVLSKVIRNYVLLPDEGFEPVMTYEVILKTRSGLNVKFEKRVNT